MPKKKATSKLCHRQNCTSKAHPNGTCFCGKGSCEMHLESILVQAHHRDPTSLVPTVLAVVPVCQECMKIYIRSVSRVGTKKPGSWFIKQMVEAQKLFERS
jgi:hypothetical protein